MNSRRGFVGGILFISAFFVFGFGGGARALTLVSYGNWGNIYTQTLTKENSPYYVWGGNSMSVRDFDTLTIEPGVVVKFCTESWCGGPSTLSILGNLIANGTADEPIIFTSLNDSAGETDTSTWSAVPHPGDWGGIEIVNSWNKQSSITHAIFRYGGTALQISSSVIPPILEHLEFDHNSGYGVSIYTGTDIHSSSFHDNLGGAIFTYWLQDSNTYAHSDATNNWWGDVSGPTTLMNIGGTGQTISGDNVLFSPWLKSDPTINNLSSTLTFPMDTNYDGITATSSFKSDPPTFKVVYSDKENTEPAYVKVYIDGHGYPMTKIGGDGDYANGETYTYTSSSIAVGAHDFFMEANDGQNLVRLPAGVTKFQIKNTLVILIPGILGTELKNGNDTLWLNVTKMAGDWSNSFMDPLMMNDNGLPSDSNVTSTGVINVIDYFDGLVKTFASDGYTEGVDLFVFPYDWRLDNRANSLELKNKIDSVLAQNESGKVDLVAHSMGGLIAKQYVLDNGPSKVDKLVFVGTPHLGAPKAFKALVEGDNFGIPVIFNPIELKKLAHNMSSIYELLPTANFFGKFGGYLDSVFGTYSFGGTNAYLLNNGANSGLLANAEQFHSDALDNFDTQGLKTYNIMGCDTPTIGRIIPRNVFLEGGVTKTEYDLKWVLGDETVPFTSARSVHSDKQFYVNGAKHSKMPSQEGIKQLIPQILMDENDINLPSAIRNDDSNCHFSDLNFIKFSVFSPVNIDVSDSDNHHVGINPDGSIEEGIPGAVYETMGSDKFILVPASSDQTYSVKLSAYATGTFSFRMENLKGSKTEQTIYFNDLPVNPQSQAKIEVVPNSSEIVMQLDENGTGNYVPVPASSELDATKSEDYTPPMTSPQVSGPKGQNGWYLSTTTVSLSANDNNSGILKTLYSVNNGNTWNTYSGPFIIEQEGTSTILYKSIDQAGNREVEKTVDISIDRSPPEAIISFDTFRKDIKVEGLDNFSSVTVEDAGNKVILSDEAGNKTILNFSERDRRKSLTASLKSIQYNGVELDKSNKKSFNYNWSFDKQENLKELGQIIMVIKDFAIAASYSAKPNVTIIRGRDVELGKVKEKISGLVLLKIQTDKGGLDYKF